ncbi:MAG: hypothetical protein COW65_05940 [Cytophagales bacterium CG18_big_fil_WC_8_21_14_2_50_42_9]|nr:MAG: hypothetical protein COW65_05940 [Cytophagales bacterium CG18_big_fil_WC_8_21_14_2_50_42_9]
MKLKSIIKYRYFYLILFFAHSSCERIFDKNATYLYVVQNNTTKPLEVRFTQTVIGNNVIQNKTIQPGVTGGIWQDTDYDDDYGRFVYDREKYSKEVTGFRIESLSKEGMLMKSNPNDSKRWTYKKTKSYKATYTLTIEETDF